MKISQCIIGVVMLGLVSGCATMGGTAGISTPAGEAAGESIIKQRTEFKDLPADMQEAITHGG